jgi:hypothetical protein
MSELFILTRNVLKKVVKGDGKANKNYKSASKKKVGGVLRHPVLTLKMVARLPSKDIKEFMKALKDTNVMKVVKQKIRDRQRQRARVTRSLEEVPHNFSNGFSNAVSMNNDWMHWVTLKGSEEATVIDIQDFGKTIGVSFKASCNNRFDVLSRPKKVVMGPVLTPVGFEEGEVDGAV